jgi:hypothetical protein
VFIHTAFAKLKTEPAIEAFPSPKVFGFLTLEVSSLGFGEFVSSNASCLAIIYFLKLNSRKEKQNNRNFY